MNRSRNRIFPATGSPLPCARTAGVLYALIILLGISGEFLIRSRLIVPEDAAATASNILGAPGLFRTGFLADSLMVLCDVGLAVLLYWLLRPAGPLLALLALCLRLAQATVIAMNLLNYHAALLILDGSGTAGGFAPDAAHALAYLYVDLHAHGYDLGLLLFGIHCIVLGYLIYRSSFLPRVLGILAVAGGVTYLVGSYIRFLLPHYVGTFMPMYGLALVAEVSLCLWLLIRGVNAARWHQRAAMN